MQTVQKRGKTKYPGIVDFANKIGLTRVGVFQALERNDPDVWEKYAEFRVLVERKAAKRVIEAKRKASRASKLAEAETIAYHKEEQDRIYGPEYETFTQ